MINLHINWNIICINPLEKTIYTENFSIILAIHFNNLLSVASYVEEKSSLYMYFRIFGLTCKIRFQI